MDNTVAQITISEMQEQIVLIVDDNPTNLQVMARHLEEQGLRILVSRDGEGALKKLQYIHPDIILLDILMPGIDGFETCRRLKAEEHTKDIPVIFMTALETVEDKVKGFAAGGVDYITKPFHQEEVLARVLTHLRIQKLQHHLQQQNIQLRQEIDERKKAEEKLRIAHEEIVRLAKGATEQQMAGGFAHEMRNALAGPKMVLDSIVTAEGTVCRKTVEELEGLFDLIEHDIPQEKKEELLGFFQRIERNQKEGDRILNIATLAITRAMEVTNLISEYSHLGRITPEDERIDLQKVLNAVIREHQQRFTDAQIAVHVQLADTSPLRGSQAHFYSMFNNLILNACEAFAELDDERERLLEITLTEHDQKQHIHIRDNAIGIPEENLPRVFEPFFSSKPSKGTGLGLSFVTKLVDIYRGTVDVESEVGKGTTFLLTFP